MKYIYRFPLFALFLFVMTGFVITHQTVNGQTPTLPPPLPTLAPLPSGLPTLEPLPSGIPTLPSVTPVPIPSGFPTLPSVTPLPTLPPPAGEGVIFGFINDENEDALKDVEVTLDGADFSDSAITDEDGFFQFGNLSAGEYTLTCEKEGYETYTETIILGVDEIREVAITMEETVKGTIYGYVLNIIDDPVENVKIKAKGVKTGYRNTAITDADGYFEFAELDADTYIIIARKKGFKRVKSTVTLGEGETQEIEIVLKKTSKKIKVDTAL